MQKEAVFKKIKAEYDYFSSGQFFFDGIPVPVAMANTDADGKFRARLPAGKYVVAASTARKVGTSEETYYWLVQIDTSRKNESLMLSNDNLFGTSCGECIQFAKVATK